VSANHGDRVVQRLPLAKQDLVSHTMRIGDDVASRQCFRCKAGPIQMEYDVKQAANDENRRPD
jgi:hypothetical protein